MFTLKGSTRVITTPLPASHILLDRHQGIMPTTGIPWTGSLYVTVAGTIAALVVPRIKVLLCVTLHVVIVTRQQMTLMTLIRMIGF